MAQTQPNALSSTRGGRIFLAYRLVLPQTFRSPAFWCFVALYLAAVAVYHFAGGSSTMLGEYFAYLLAYSFILLALIPLTRGAPAPAWTEEQLSLSQLRWQLLALSFFVLLSMAYDFVFLFIIQPLWGKENPAFYFITSFGIPLLLLFALPILITRLLGSSWRALGFTRGYRSWWTMLVSSILPLLFAGVLLGIGYLTARGWIISGMQTLLFVAFPEEAFFRGLLFTRLYRLLGVQWSILFAALIFGIVHLAVNMYNGDTPGMALAECVLDQMTFGLLMTIIFLRTRSILAGTLLHTLIDALNF